MCIVLVLNFIPADSFCLAVRWGWFCWPEGYWIVKVFCGCLSCLTLNKMNIAWLIKMQFSFFIVDVARRPARVEQIYNLFYVSDPCASRLEPLLLRSLRNLAPVSLPRYQHYPLGIFGLWEYGVHRFFSRGRPVNVIGWCVAEKRAFGGWNIERHVGFFGIDPLYK